ncbi:MAG: Rne/Rng family ribonuclease [Actinomycetia bacterium]|nr:Rne/Rng family ribonuclease [Actinomycetes bacterium]MCP5032545.1 Rne/Rng family ribonuclease [Actinomycetes bacterium]
MSDVSESGGSSAGRTPNPSQRGRTQDGNKRPPASNEPASGSTSAKPKIGDTRPAPARTEESNSAKQNTQNKEGSSAGSSSASQSRRRRRRRGGSKGAGTDNARGGPDGSGSNDESGSSADQSQGRGQGRGQGQKQGQRQGQKGQKRSGQRRSRNQRSGGGNRNEAPVSQVLADSHVELDEDDLKNRRGRSRKGRPVGRYLMVVSKQEDATHIAILEGRTLIEYYVSRPSDDVYQIHGNIYLGRVQNVLPGMEAAFVDIGTPKNAVIYRGDVQYDKEDFDGAGSDGPRIEQMLKPRQAILCQVTKNPIAHKGARLTTEVSLPGRFVVLVPNSDTYGISKRLPDDERKRLRQILDRVRPSGHGLIVRTAAENVTAAEIERDIAGLVQQWADIGALAKRSKAPSLLYQEPDMSVRVIREEFNKEYRGVVIDDEALHNEVSEYVSLITPALADRVEHYDKNEKGISLFERFHVYEQLHKALDRKVWLPSGGSLIIESTEALTVIDVNTGKNVGSSNLEDTVFRNNLEAAEGIARQLRLRDIGGIIVIDFVDMETRKNREEVMRVFRAALSRDKTRTQVFDISDLGLAEMTRKRIGEGLLESLSEECPHCVGRGLEVNAAVLSSDG